MNPEIQQLNQRIEILEGIIAGMMKSNQYTLWKDVVFNKNIEIKDGVNIALKATTGSKLGTASTQKLGFFNATPVAQQAAISAPTGGGTAGVDTPARTAINSIRTALTNLGLTA